MKEVKVKVDEVQRQELAKIKMKKLFKYKKDDLVIWTKMKDDKTVKEKDTTQTCGVYQVCGYEMNECAQATQSIEDSVHLLLINPYVGMDS